MSNWFPLFCGHDDDIEKLKSHLSSSPLSGTVRFEQIMDEEKAVSLSSFVLGFFFLCICTCILPALMYMYNLD